MVLAIGSAAERLGLGTHQGRDHAPDHRPEQVRIRVIAPLAQPLQTRRGCRGHHVPPSDHEQPEDAAVAAASPPRFVHHAFGH
jgi:hypothetical protein